MGLKQGALEAYKENYFKINASPGSSGGSVRGVPQSLQEKTAGRMRSGQTLQDVNISFNHFPYYSMNRGEGGVVTKECLVTKPSGRKSSAWPRDSPAGVSVEGIQIDDLYRADQRVS